MIKVLSFIFFSIVVGFFHLGRNGFTLATLSWTECPICGVQAAGLRGVWAVWEKESLNSCKINICSSLPGTEIESLVNCVFIGVPYNSSCGVLPVTVLGILFRPI
ncbi:hypothetical protein FKM82_021575 [Ascaphus truei]